MSDEKSKEPEYDVTKLLPEATQGRLRTAWRAEEYTMVQVAAGVASKPFPPAGELIMRVASYLYRETSKDPANKAPLADSSVLEPMDRERCLIAIFTNNDQEGYAFAIHVYWGLMTGLAVRDIADTVALAGAYSGLPAYINGMDRLKSVFGHLVGLVAEGKDLSPGKVAGSLRTRYAITR